MMRLACIILACFVLGSCKTDKVPKDVLAPEKMQAVFWDYIRADVFAKEYLSADSTKNAEKENARLQQLVFDKHKVSKSTFYKSYDYYLHHETVLTGMLDTMLVRQQALHDSADARRNRAIRPIEEIK